MTPQHQVPNDPFTISTFFGVLSTVVEKVPHKMLLSIAAALLSILMYWGFTRTFTVQDQQAAAQQEIRKEMLARFDRLDLKMEVEKEKSHKQDLCLQETKRDIQDIKETIKRVHPKVNGLHQ